MKNNKNNMPEPPPPITLGDLISIDDWEKFKKKFNKKFDYGSMSIHRDGVLDYIYKELLSK
jgi:hypothetical protein